MPELREPERAQALMRLTQAARRGTVTLLTRDQGRLPQPGGGAGRAGAGRRCARAAVRGLAADVPGDPACWLRRVCPVCGTIAEADPPVTCPQCHAAITGD